MFFHIFTNMESGAVLNEWSYEWLDSLEALELMSSALENEEILSLDTETVGWQYGNERLALIQVGVPSKKHVFVIDPIKIGDISSMQRFISSNTPKLIGHNIQFEERQFLRHAIHLKGGIDTLAMARELRPDLPNHTLQTCCRLILGKSISKQEQTSDWSRRPLTEEQLKYARLDAELAYELYAALADMKSKLHIDPAIPVPELMKLLSETAGKRLKLMAAVSPELALMNAKDKALRDAIRMKLSMGEAAYSGEFGNCKVIKIKKTEINPQKVKTVFPQFAHLAVAESVDRDRLKALMKEYAEPESKIELVLDITGYTDRLTLHIK